MQQLFKYDSMRNTSLNVRVALVFFLVLFSFNTQASCNSTNIDSFLNAKNIKFIDISTNKGKKWTKNYIKAVQSSRSTGQILEKYKKRYKAKITVLFDNNLSCIFSAKIRISGDYHDHLNSTPPVASLDVKLLNGNIDSVIKFKLFIPHTRGGDNEIFATALFRELGFLAPKSYNVPALFNGKETTFLFQEKITKEFIESNDLREAPILEGDERHMQGNLSHKFALTRVTNKKWINKGVTSLLISQKALTQLNKAYLQNLLVEHVYKDLYRVRRPLKANYSNENAINKEREFKAIMLAIGAFHGLSADDMRYYYDPMYQSFSPIYYDGDAHVLNIEKIKINKNPPSIDEVMGANIALVSLKSLSRERFKDNLNILGLDYNLKKIDAILNNIILNLESIAVFSLNNIKTRPYTPYFSNYKEGGRLVFATAEEFRIEVCDFALTACDFEDLTLKEYSKLLAAKYNDSYIFVGDKEEYITGINKQEQGEKNQFSLGDKVELISYGGAKILLDRKKRKIDIYQNSINDRVLLKGGSLEGWSVKFVGLKSNFVPLNKQRFNQNLLTGCLTFLDMQVHDVDIDININGSLCEDGVNLVRVNGDLNNVVIKNASSDAVDVDFSKLNFKNIKVSDAGNDCIDLSSGSYHIENAELKGCKDKAISVGEKSKLTINVANISKSNIGMAAKDSSVIEVDDITNNTVTTCFSAYNKKQEFWGGKITVNKHNCQPSQVFQQTNSLVEFIQ